MASTKDVVKLAVDSYNGVPTGYSKDQTMDTLQKAFVAANNGKTYIDPRDVRDGKCNQVFAITEEIITKTVIDGLQGNEFFMNLVEHKNLALGDTNEFFTPDDSLFYVAEIARGTEGIRSQRLNGGTRISTNIKTYGVKIREELDRILAGRVDFTDMINRVGQSILTKQYEDIFKAWTSMVTPTVGGTTYIPATGSYDEGKLLNLCEHVETNNGTAPVIMGTMSALRNIKTAEVSDSAKESMYNIGYYGRLGPYPMVRIKQIHKTNTDEFILPDNQLYIIGADIKPIKYVNEGESYIRTIDNNADFSQEYYVINNAGVSVMLPDKRIGVYTMS